MWTTSHFDVDRLAFDVDRLPFDLDRLPFDPHNCAKEHLT